MSWLIIHLLNITYPSLLFSFPLYLKWWLICIEESTVPSNHYYAIDRLAWSLLNITFYSHTYSTTIENLYFQQWSEFKVSLMIQRLFWKSKLVAYSSQIILSCYKIKLLSRILRRLTQCLVVWFYILKARYCQNRRIIIGINWEIHFELYPFHWWYLNRDSEYFHSSKFIFLNS